MCLVIVSWSHIALASSTYPAESIVARVHSAYSSIEDIMLCLNAAHELSLLEEAQGPTDGNVFANQFRRCEV
jgi:hypothetical protein